MNKLETLRSVFGHDRFRYGQEELVDALLSDHDVLGVMPTGAGKSICYQLPAVMRSGVALVISPLISLMKDQVMALNAAGIRAAYINSSLTLSQQAQALRRASEGEYQLVYVAPERLTTPAFMAFASSVEISLVAVDEAHCVSKWGQDFRPGYLQIAAFVNALPERPPVAALTATATSMVRKDIIELLQLNHPKVMLSGYNRPNLRFVSLKPTSRISALMSFLEKRKNQSGIVYCATRKTVEQVAHTLQAYGFSAAPYHAGMSAETRHRNQEDFRYDRVRIMVATNAFGLGIDKANVRFVLHYQMPTDLENYYQEAGRAGRDGEPAQCVLLYGGSDVYRGRWFIKNRRANPDLDERDRLILQERDEERLKQMTFYATSRYCLRHFILHYFGDPDAMERCENCSVCSGDPFYRGLSTKRRPMLPWEKNWPTPLPPETALLERLNTLRKLIAQRSHKPAFLIFSNTALKEMVCARPVDTREFMNVNGVGKNKALQYAEVFLAVLRDGQTPEMALQRYEAALGAGKTNRKRTD